MELREERLTAYLVARITDHSALLGECFEGMARNEPGRLHVVLFEELKETTGSNSPSEESWLRVSQVMYESWGFSNITSTDIV
jgi:hypothetical protein